MSGRVHASGGYWGAAHNRRFRHFLTADRGPNSLITSEGERLRARARQLARGSSQGAAARAAAETHVVAEGIKPRSQHPVEAVRERLDELWGRWAAEADADGVDDLYGLQATVAAADFLDGEVFIRRRPRLPADGLTVPLQVQAMEADMLPLLDWQQPVAAGAAPMNEIIGGVELDALQRRVAYHFFKRHPRDQVLSARGVTESLLTSRIPASEILHVYRRLRPGQLRGETGLASVIEAIWQIQQLSVSELDRAALASRLNVFITQAPSPDYDTPLGALASAGALAREGVSGANPDAEGTADIDLESGVIPVLPEGQKPEYMDVKHDAAAFEKFVLVKHHEVAAGSGTSYELLTGDYSRTSFSSARTSLRAFQRRVQQTQRRMIVQFLNPLWRWFVDAAFLSGALKDARYPANRADYLAVDWTEPRVEFVDPLKELQAYDLAVRAGFLSREQVIEELGYDPRVVNERIKRERASGMVFDSGQPQQDQQPKTPPAQPNEPEEEATLLQ